MFEWIGTIAKETNKRPSLLLAIEGIIGFVIVGGVIYSAIETGLLAVIIKTYAYTNWFIIVIVSFVMLVVGTILAFSIWLFIKWYSINKTIFTTLVEVAEQANIAKRNEERGYKILYLKMHVTIHANKPHQIERKYTIHTVRDNINKCIVTMPLEGDFDLLREYSINGEYKNNRLDADEIDLSKINLQEIERSDLKVVKKDSIVIDEIAKDNNRAYITLSFNPSLKINATATFTVFESQIPAKQFATNYDEAVALANRGEFPDIYKAGCDYIYIHNVRAAEHITLSASFDKALQGKIKKPVIANQKKLNQFYLYFWETYDPFSHINGEILKEEPDLAEEDLVLKLEKLKLDKYYMLYWQFAK